MLTAVMVGCGAMSNGWLKAIRDTAVLEQSLDIVGFVDLDEAAAARQAKAYGFDGAKIGTDLEAVLAETNPDIVFDLVVPVARTAVVKTALRHGAHVLSEKPMANSMDEAHELLAEAKASGKSRAIIQNRRFLDGIRRARALIDSKELGDITAIHADFFIAPHFGGFRDEMDHVLLLDMAIHTFDAARFLLPSEPVAVFCQETNPAGSWYAHGAAANALFDCSDGTVFSYRGSWCAEGMSTGWESAWRIVGTKGSVLWDGNAEFDGLVVDGDDGFLRPTRPVAVPETPSLSAQGHAGAILDFVSALKTGQTPLNLDSDNINSLAMVFAAIESAETGRRIEFGQHRKAS